MDLLAFLTSSSQDRNHLAKLVTKQGSNCPSSTPSVTVYCCRRLPTLSRRPTRRTWTTLTSPEDSSKSRILAVFPVLGRQIQACLRTTTLAENTEAPMSNPIKNQSRLIRYCCGCRCWQQSTLIPNLKFELCGKMSPSM